RGVGPLQERWELPLQRPEGRVNRRWYAGQHESGEGDRQEEQPPAALPPFAPQAREEERRDQAQEGEWLKEVFRESKIHARNLVLVCGAEGRRFAVESPGSRPRRSAPGAVAVPQRLTRSSITLCRRLRLARSQATRRSPTRLGTASGSTRRGCGAPGPGSGSPFAAASTTVAALVLVPGSGRASPAPVAFI